MSFNLKGLANQCHWLFKIFIGKWGMIYIGYSKVVVSIKNILSFDSLP